MIESNRTPSYYTVLPAAIRYDKNLTHLEKILYGEIVALTNRYGYCYAGNDYFTSIFGNSERTISRSISNLQDKGYIACFIEKGGEGYGGSIRKIYLVSQAIDIPNKQAERTKESRSEIPRGQKCLHNNNYNNSTKYCSTAVLSTNSTKYYNTNNNTKSTVSTRAPENAHGANGPSESKSDNPVKPTLPIWLGSSSTARLLRLYELLWSFNMGVELKLKLKSMQGRQISNLLKDDNELMVGLLLVLHFEWRGMDDKQEGIHSRIAGSGYPIGWIPSSVGTYKAYIKNKLGIDNDEAAKEKLDNVIKMLGYELETGKKL